MTAGEAGVAAALLVVCSLTWASLALANLGWHSLPAVLALAGGVVGSTLLALRRFAPVTVVLDRHELAALAALVLAAGVFLFPGFRYNLGDKDPGLYVATGIAMAREGATTFPDSVVSNAKALGERPVTRETQRLPGIAVAPDGTSRVQFYPLWSAVIATAYDLAGYNGVFNLTPVLGLVAIACFALAVRRGAGGAAGLLCGALLVTNMLQVWQAKYPTTETLTELFIGGGLFLLVVAVEERWAPAAVLAGVCATLSFLTRPDGLLVVLMLLGFATLALTFAHHRHRSRRVCVAALAGALVLSPHALWNAYSDNRGYSLTNGLPSLALVLLVLGAVVLGGAVLYRFDWTVIAARLERGGAQRGVRALIVSAVVVAGVVLYKRGALLGETMTTFSGRIIPAYNERNLRWLGYFTTRVGLVIAAGGLTVVTTPRWRLRRWLLVLPGGLLAPLYLWEAKISPRLMWWGRRFVPAVLPLVLVLMAVALAYLLAHRRRDVRTVGAVLSIGLLATFVSQSWPLRAHDEFGGSRPLVAHIGELVAGKGALVLWEAPRAGDVFDPSRVLPAPVWLEEGAVSAVLRAVPTVAQVRAYRAVYPERTVFVATHGAAVPAGLTALDWRRVEDLSVRLDYWEESVSHRPSFVDHYDVALYLWRLEA